jgi:hypothetical protein
LRVKNVTHRQKRKVTGPKITVQNLTINIFFQKEQ